VALFIHRSPRGITFFVKKVIKKTLIVF